MPKINVYLPDDLAAAVRDARLPVSPICQRALAEALRTVGAARRGLELLRDPEFDPRRHPQIGERIAARMTPRAASAVDRARGHAGPAAPVRPTDLLIGVLDEPGNLAVQILAALDVDLTALRAAAVDAGEMAGPSPELTIDAPGDPLADLSTEARVVLGAALEASIELGHNFLGCEHLLLALTEPDAGGDARHALGDTGVSADTLRRAIRPAVAGATLGLATAQHAAAPQSVMSRLDALERRLEELERRATPPP